MSHAASGKCACCNGTGYVLTATGERRPCSRCNDAYHEWAKVYFWPQAKEADGDQPS